MIQPHIKIHYLGPEKIIIKKSDSKLYAALSEFKFQATDTYAIINVQKIG